MFDFNGVSGLQGGARIEGLTGLARRVLASEVPASEREGLVQAIVEALEGSQGTSRQRLALSEALARLGDPRLRAPSDEAYWCTLGGAYSGVAVGAIP